MMEFISIYKPLASYLTDLRLVANTLSYFAVNYPQLFGTTYANEIMCGISSGYHKLVVCRNIKSEVS